MNKRVFGTIAMTAFAVAGWAMCASACEQHKQTTAKSTSVHGAKVTAVTAGAGMGSCTPEMAAACKTSGKSGHKMSSASAAGMSDCCAGKAKGATASIGHDACATKTIGAGMIGAPSCGHGGTSATVAEMKGECDACADMISCSSQVTANDAQTQIVPLRNGVMFVYTTDTPAQVRAVQNAVARRGDRLTTLTQSGDRARLCPECRSARGAIASGKMTRETVNIEGGCMTLVTSSDPALVAKLRALAAASNGRNKS